MYDSHEDEFWKEIKKLHSKHFKRDLVSALFKTALILSLFLFLYLIPAH